MRRIFQYIFLLLLLAGAFSSCLKSGLPSAKNSSLKAMTSFNYEYRWYDTSYTQPGTPQADTTIAVNVVQLSNSVTISNDTVYTHPTFPANLPAAQIPNVTLGHIWAYASIPDASLIIPMSGAPKLGAPGDFTHPVSYQITAADGSTASWVVVTAPLH
jgi:hypothetical protein